MKFKHRPRRRDENGITKRFIQQVNYFKRSRTEPALFMVLQGRGYNLGNGGWHNFSENSKKLDAAVTRIKKMHREYRRKHGNS